MNSNRNLTRYYEFMASYKIGRPVFFFVLAQEAKGKPNDSKIREVEKYLIDLGLTANEDLLNKRDTKQPGWGIQGVIRGGQGRFPLAQAPSVKCWGSKGSRPSGREKWTPQS